VIYGHTSTCYRDETEAAAASGLLDEFAREAARLGGTISAEHGVGKRKAKMLAVQYTKEQIEPMKAVKRRFDPHWLLGRGTIFPYMIASGDTL
jgi:FAD/FMN-containing dehydrogenase